MRVDGIAAAEYAELKQLGDIAIDDVLAVIDHPVRDYRDLYYRWECQQWEAGSIDFSDDRTEWVERLSPELKRSLVSALSSLSVAKDQLASALVPFVDAAPSEEQQVFLTTQLVDQARHMVFFDRFYAGVVEDVDGDMTARLEGQKRRLNRGASTLVLEMLPEVAERIRAEPDDRDALVDGVVLCHLMIQGMLGLTSQRFLLAYAAENSLLVGLRQGLTAIARDEARHVAFGLKFLSDMVEDDVRFDPMIATVVRRVVPVTLSALEPEGSDGYGSFTDGRADLETFALAALKTRLDLVGVRVEPTD
ncbi:MAG TPA: ribonucleotide-diphosphate reductase subunit beta [Actinomycetota bacterium]|nr:ribonucleotide-diphosphate reductase subunit beta [Actinomycetota bacterium]